MADGFEGYDQWRCSPPVDYEPDPSDPHDECEREIAGLHAHIDELEVELAALKGESLTYSQFHAAIRERFAGTFHTRVETWCHTPLGGLETPCSRWSITWFPAGGGVRQVEESTAENALRAFDAAQVEIENAAGSTTGEV